MNLPSAAMPPAEAKPQPEPANDHDGRIKALADEASAINQKYGIDMGSILASDKDLQRRVFVDGESLNAPPEPSRPFDPLMVSDRYLNRSA